MGVEWDELVTRLFLTRHGETVANEGRRFSGHSDVALTTRGKAQARALGRRLRHERIDAAYASDLSRARATAEIALRGRELLVTPQAGLRELCFGDWEGLTFQEVREGWPQEFRQFLSVGEGFCAPGGEPLDETRARVVAAMNEIVGRHSDRNVLVVAHGGTLNILLAYVLGISAGNMFRLATNNCGLSIVEFHGERPFVTLVNDCGHTAPRRQPAASGG